MQFSYYAVIADKNFITANHSHLERDIYIFFKLHLLCVFFCFVFLQYRDFTIFFNNIKNFLFI